MIIAITYEEVRSQESEVRSQEAGGRRQEAEDRIQESGVRRQKSGGRSQEAGGRRQETKEFGCRFAPGQVLIKSCHFYKEFPPTHIFFHAAIWWMCSGVSKPKELWGRLVLYNQIACLTAWCMWIALLYL